MLCTGNALTLIPTSIKVLLKMVKIDVIRWELVIAHRFGQKNQKVMLCTENALTLFPTGT